MPIPGEEWVAEHTGAPASPRARVAEDRAILATFGEWAVLAQAVETPDGAALDAAETAVLAWYHRGTAATLTEEEAVAVATFLVPLLRCVTDGDEGPAAVVVGTSAERTTGDGGEERWLVTLEGQARDSVVHSGQWWDTEIRLTWRLLLPVNAPDLDKTHWSWHGQVAALPPPDLAAPAEGRLAGRRQEKRRRAFEAASAIITWTAAADWTPVGPPPDPLG